eukprot:TRINITY_DN2801_c4_g1_i1.p1 TRINITY_DN2801_c4_g1~~TRINITY_DN2801_c4_g1_i1.p1  ORF type:complete len:2164 (+),score=294.83 TRINITY_DN2801_c4_g1_i1:1425-7916(+)
MERIAKERQYEYREYATLVLKGERPRARGDESTGEAGSLAGRKLEKFGGLATREKPPGPPAEKDKAAKQKEILDPTREAALPTFKGPSHVLDTSIAEEQLYRPRTRETRALYEELLAIIQKYTGDASQEVIRGAADQVLAILKTESLRDVDKKKEVETLLMDKVPDEEFNRLLVMSKQFIDFMVDEERDMRAAEQEQLMDIAVNIEEREPEEMSEKEVAVEEEEAKEGPEAMVTVGTKEAERGWERARAEEDAEIKDLLTGYWLQEELLKYFSEPETLKVEKAVLTALGDPNARACESQLLEILNYEKYDLVKKLLEHRYKIYYLTLLGKAQSADERNKVMNEMKETSEGVDLLRKLEHLEERRDKGTELTRQLAGEAERLNRMHLGEIREEAESTAFGLEGVHVKDIDRAIAPKTLDLESMAFAQGAHFMSNKRCTLPKDTVRTSKKGYEEVFVPATKQKIAEDEKLVPISALPDWAREAFPPPIEKLNRIQSRIYNAAFKGSENLLVCAPTGAGKTNIAMLTIMHEVGLHMRPNGEINTDAFKIVYIAPMKALVAETVGGFSQRLEPYGINVRELTGDVHLTKAEIDAAQIIVTTPEKWDVITRKSAERSFINKVKLVIIDEIHLLHDMRGPVLESLVARTIRQIESTQELVRIVALSATLPNYKDVAAFLRVRLDVGLFFFDNSYRPVPLEQTYIGVTERKAIKRLMLMNEILYEKIMERAGKHQILVFVHSRKETARTAKVIRDMALAKDELAKFLKEVSRSREILQSQVNLVKNQDLKDLLVYGIGIHHAGLSRKDRNTVESLFADKHLQVLVSTATLAWGVNLPAHTVIIKGTQIYSPEQGRWVELSPQDILQMMGRAGRPHYDKTGEGLVITTHTELQYYLSLNNMQLPIESQLLSQLPDHLNAEIVLGTVSNTKEAVTWLGYTYLYVRMLRSPELYGVTPEEFKKDKYLVQHRADLIHTAATILDKANLIKYDRRTGIFQVTALGRVASHYYIKHDSMSIYNENLKSNMGMIDLFRVFAMSKEFQYVIIREEEKQELKKFADLVPVPVKASMEEPLAKVIVLLQAYISRYRLEGYALNSDMVYVSQSAGRIMRAIFEIALKKGWAQLADTALKCFKMVDRRMWSVASPLRQFKGIPEEVLRKLEKKEQFTWEHYHDMTPQQLGEIVKFAKMGKTLHTLIHQVPKLELSAYVQPITRNCLSIELTVIPRFDWDVHTHGYAEPFWVIVEDVDEELILHYEQLIIKQKYANEEHVLNFTVMLYEPMPPQYFIKVVSDRWINAEAVLPISFRHLMLPEKFPPHVELLDLPPLKPVELEWPEAEKALFGDITKFNAIQTQTFNALYNSDENVFVGAPTSSGKTTCAEFAMLRMMQKNDKGVWLYITSMAPVAQLTYKRWKKSFEEELGVPVVLLTGQAMIDLKQMEGTSGRIVIGTAEQWDILSRRWKQRRQVQDVSLMVVDEIQLLTESGSVLEVILSRMRYMSSQLEKLIRIIGLGVSIADSKDVAEWLGVKPPLCFNFQPIVRPIPLELNIQGFEHNERTARLYAMSKPAYKVIKQYAVDGKKQCIVFTSDRKQTRLTALDFLMHAAYDYSPDQFVKGSKEECEEQAKKVKEKALVHVLTHGVGYLHDGLTNKDKQIVRELYERKHLQVLVVAYNLCWEISDLYSYMGIVLDPQRYDGHEHRYVEFSIPDMLQMLGRAGQPGVDESAKFFVFCHTPRKDYFKKFLYESLPIESHLDHFFHDHLNAEVVAQTIENKHDAIDWLTWTFYYRRLTKNPNYYNLQGITGEHINDHLSELVENTVEELEKALCLRVEQDVVLIPANLGRIASYYYIKYLTIQMFAKSLNEGRKLKALLEILSASSEFEEIPIRHGEEALLHLLNEQIEYRVEGKEKLNEPASKANILLQCHFGRIPISADFATDQKFLLEKAVRLIHAMIDVISSNGWLKPALLAMEMSQMVTQAMWATDSPLWQLPHFDRGLVAKCKAAEINDILDLMNMEEEDRSNLLKMDEEEISQVAAVCNRYPTIDMKVEVAESESLHAGESVVVTVDLGRDLETAAVPPVYAPYYPLEKEEYWWIVIGDSARNKLLAIKRLVIPQNASAKLSFMVEDPGKYQLKTYLICDSYVGADQEETLALNVAPGEAMREDSAGEEQMAQFQH